MGVFDFLDGDTLWNCLMRSGVPVKYISILNRLYCQTKGRVRAYGKLSPPLSRLEYVKAAPSPRSSLEFVMNNIVQDALAGIQDIDIQIRPGDPIADLDYADDIALLGEDAQAVQQSLDRLAMVALKYGLHSAPSKSKVFLQNWQGAAPALTLTGNSFDMADRFVYLGSCVTVGGTIGNEIALRIQKACSAFTNRKHLWRRHDISLPLKGRVYKMTVRAVLLHGCETWSLRTEDLRRLSVFDSRCLRSIARVRWEDHITNDEEPIHVSKETSSESSDLNAHSETLQKSENAVANGEISFSAPPQSSALNGNLKPAYWLCYPVYLPLESTAVKVSVRATGDVKKEPPLSFDEWLKKENERTPATDSTCEITCKSLSAKPSNLPTNQVQVNCCTETEDSRASSEITQAAESTATLEEPLECRPASDSSPSTLILDDEKASSCADGGSNSRICTAVCDNGGGPERSSTTAALYCESPIPGEPADQMPASLAVTQAPLMVPIPAPKTPKETAQQILRSAALRHRQRASAMQARMEGTSTDGRLQQQTHWTKWFALAVAVALIALLLRRIAIMYITGPF